MDQVQEHPTFESLFRKAAVSQNAFSRKANVDYSVIRKARDGQNISELSALKLLNALNSLLGTSYQLEEIAWKYGTAEEE